MTRIKWHKAKERKADPAQYSRSDAERDFLKQKSIACKKPRDKAVKRVAMKQRDALEHSELQRARSAEYKASSAYQKAFAAERASIAEKSKSPVEVWTEKRSALTQHMDVLRDRWRERSLKHP